MKKMIPPKPAGPKGLLISVSLGEYRSQNDPINSDAAVEYADIRRKVLEHAGYTCHRCGFQSVPDRKAPATSFLASGYIEVHHKDTNHKNNTPRNLGATCPFCHMPYHIGFNGHQGRCSLIFCPWLTQEQVNLLVMGLGVAISRKKDKIGRKAANLLSYLEGLNIPLKKQYGPDMADPVQLAWVLRTLAVKNKALYQKRNKILADFRVLPNINKFKDQIRYWAATGWMPGEKWEDAWEKTYQQWEKSQKSQ